MTTNSEKLPKVKIFTDGAVRGNPGGPGGYAAILIRGKSLKKVCGFDPKTSNNRMEMRAAIAGILVLHRRCRVEIWTDSEYLYKGMTQWSPDWRKRGWKTRDGKQVANQDMWSFLHNLSLLHEISWKWVRGHSGHKYNEMADDLAGKALKQGIKNLERKTAEEIKQKELEADNPS